MQAGAPARGPADPWAVDFPARLGRLAAELHEALPTPSEVVPEPRRPATAADASLWHAEAVARVDEALAAGRELDGAAEVLAARADELRAALAPSPTPLVRPPNGCTATCTSGRCCAGRAVSQWSTSTATRWSRAGTTRSRTSRRLVISLSSCAASTTLRGSRSAGPRASTPRAVLAWLERARPQLLDAYRSELARLDAADLLDERPLPA